MEPWPTRAQETLNCATHGVGAALSIAGMVILVAFAALKGDAWRVTSLSIYGAMMITLYLISTLYHGFRNPRVKRWFQLMDHVAIYLLIAGTYTPVTLIFMRGKWGWTLFGAIWGLAILGIVVRVTLKSMGSRIRIALYVLMGWLAIAAIKPVLATVPPGLVVWLGAGGLFYMCGLIFFGMHKLEHHHAIWHVFVLAGSACHFLGLLIYATAVLA